MNIHVILCSSCAVLGEMVLRGENRLLACGRGCGKGMCEREMQVSVVHSCAGSRGKSRDSTSLVTVGSRRGTVGRAKHRTRSVAPRVPARFVPPKSQNEAGRKRGENCRLERGGIVERVGSRVQRWRVLTTTPSKPPLARLHHLIAGRLIHGLGALPSRGQRGHREAGLS